MICSHVMNILYRKHRAIKASTPMLNHLIFLGCYLIITGTVINVASYHRTIVESDPALKPTMCTLFIWLISIGFTLFTGTICAKTWRLNRISQCAKEFKKNVKFIEWYHLVGFVCVLVAYDVFICSLWHSIDPFKISLTKQVVIEMEDPLLTVMITCQSTYAAHFNAAVIIPQVAVIIMSFMMAVSTNINIKEFSTSNIITLNYLQSVIIFGLELPVYIIATIRGFDSSIRDTLLCISLEVPVCIGIILLYLPLIHNHCMCLHVRTRTLFSKLSET